MAINGPNVCAAYADSIQCRGEVHESILVRDGFYCGRRLEFEQARAVWFFDENQVKVFQADGSVADVLDITRSEPSNQLKAA